jgi:hypothetical protein
MIEREKEIERGKERERDSVWFTGSFASIERNRNVLQHPQKVFMITVLELEAQQIN